MPELPEVQTVASELDRKLSGKSIEKVVVRKPKMVALGPGVLSNLRIHSPATANKFALSLKGKKIRSVSRRAKLIIIDLQGALALLVHLKMTGQFIYQKKSELGQTVRIINNPNAAPVALPCKYTHVIFSFIDGSKLFYNDMRQFGYLKLVTDQELPFVRDLAEFGPEPLSKGFTFQVFHDLLKKRPAARIKQALTDPKLIAGIGNIYSDEILFRAGVRPDRICRNLKLKERLAIFKAIPFILNNGIAARGSSVGDFVRTDGSWGKFGKHHFVYGRSGEPCKICKTTIKSKKFNGRTGSFCPRCQK